MKWLALITVLATARFSGVCLVQALVFAPLVGPLQGGNARFKDTASERCHYRFNTALQRVMPTVFMIVEVECDVAIIGGGPAGCTCALYTSRADHKTVVIDKSSTIGALARTSVIANYPGVDKTMNGQELLDMMREQALSYGTEYRRAQVAMVEFGADRKTIHTPEAIFKARALVLATGATGRKPYFKGEQAFRGRGVSYCATCDGVFYRDSEVAVVGNNPEAIEEAEFLTRFASTVHWLTPTDPPADDENANALLSQQNVQHWSRAHIESIEGDDFTVTGIKLKSTKDNTRVLPVEGVFIYISGTTPITDFLEEKLELKEDGGVMTNEEMMTSVDGVFAVGDIRNTPFKQAVVAASDGCIAAMAIDRYLKGRKRVRLDWVHQ